MSNAKDDRARPARYAVSFIAQALLDMRKNRSKGVPEPFLMEGRALGAMAFLCDHFGIEDPELPPGFNDVMGIGDHRARGEKCAERIRSRLLGSPVSDLIGDVINQPDDYRQLRVEISLHGLGQERTSQKRLILSLDQYLVVVGVEFG